jgi:hypothetical protein
MSRHEYVGQDTFGCEICGADVWVHLENAGFKFKPSVWQCEADRCLRRNRDLDNVGQPRYHPECLVEQERD